VETNKQYQANLKKGYYGIYSTTSVWACGRIEKGIQETNCRYDPGHGFYHYDYDQ
jgi:hypothetical protein